MTDRQMVPARTVAAECGVTRQCVLRWARTMRR